ncbi:MAG: B12-binding domain-containing radical SAM protein [Desulfobulbaceae bacterium A2]|nr:MAG: B12-binding domain-containing radical SAM protein [Desulfobulbaceae bacterium A2]
MKISLISPYPDVTAIGVRILSACLREAGHETQLIMMRDPFGDDVIPGVARYSDKVIEQLAGLCRESDLIGISLMTNFFFNAVEITSGLRRFLQVPIIWGGVHATIRPDECLPHADIVCVGDGEHALVQLANLMQQGSPYTGVPNLHFRFAGNEVHNPVQALELDIDSFPLPDYSLADHHILIGDAIVPVTASIMAEMLRRGTVSEMLGLTGYQTMTSRGCPFACTYCVNDMINRLYGGKGKLRWRSIANLMEELVWVKQNMPYIGYIWFSDDEFFARKSEDLAQFAAEYKDKIALPFSCLISPMSVTSEKMSMMVDAGLIYVQMGVESGSRAMQQLFNRQMMHNERMMQAIHIINSFKKKLKPPSYDFLLDVPGETSEDIVDSLRFIANIPKPYRLQPFELIPYPGTKLYDIAKKEGLIHDEHNQIYNRSYTMRQPTYLNLLFALCRTGRFPHQILKLLISRPALMLFNHRIFSPLVSLLYRAGKSLRRRGRDLPARPSV